MHENGYGVEQNYIVAIEWYTKAANQNHTIANYNLGKIYYNDQDIEKDYVIAFQYFKVVSDLGYSHALIQLRILYSQDLGIETDYEIASSLFTRASSESNAMVAVGEIYHSINNESQNFPNAFECYKNANED